MPQAEEVATWRGWRVVDPAGEEIGTLDEIYLDDDTGEPEWALVKTGLLSRGTPFVPLAGAEGEGDVVTVRFSKDQVKDAPSVKAGEELSQEQESQLYAHYGMEYSFVPSQSGMAEGQPGTEEPGAAGAAGAGAAGTAAAGAAGDQATSGASGAGGERSGDPTTPAAPGAAGTGATGAAGVPGAADAAAPGEASHAGDQGAAQTPEGASGGSGAVAAGSTDPDTPRTDEGAGGAPAGEGAAGTAVAAGTAGAASAAAQPDTDTDDDDVRVRARSQPRERVRLRKYVVTEHVTKTVPVQREEVRVEREPIEGDDAEPHGTGAAGDQEVTLNEEQAVIEPTTRREQETQ